MTSNLDHTPTPKPHDQAAVEHGPNAAIRQMRADFVAARGDGTAYVSGQSLPWDDDLAAEIERLRARITSLIQQVETIVAHRNEVMERLAAAEADADRLAEALIWCSGSPDFNEGGQAREGWLKLGRTALAAHAEWRGK